MLAAIASFIARGSSVLLVWPGPSHHRSRRKDSHDAYGDCSLLRGPGFILTLLGSMVVGCISHLEVAGLLVIEHYPL